MNNCVVYKHTSPSGKVYIGITEQVPEKRWGSNGNNYRSNIRFFNAIKKYGWDNFKHEILFENLTREDACKKEIELIAEYDSYNPKRGYNQTFGGDSGKLTEDSIKKISESVSRLWEDDNYRKHMSNIHKGQSRTGWHHTEDTKKKMSESVRNRPQSFFDSVTKNIVNYVQSDKGKAEMSLRSKELWKNEEFRKKNTAHLYGNHYRRKAVICIETGEMYESVELAANAIGKSRDLVGQCCRGKCKTAGGYHWRFANE